MAKVAKKATKVKPPQKSAAPKGKRPVTSTSKAVPAKKGVKKTPARPAPKIVSTAKKAAKAVVAKTSAIKSPAKVPAMKIAASKAAGTKGTPAKTVTKTIAVSRGLVATPVVPVAKVAPGTKVSGNGTAKLPAAKANGTVVPTAVAPGKVALPAKASGKPVTVKPIVASIKPAAASKTPAAGKKGKPGKAPPGKLVISAKPGQILLTPLKPTGTPGKPGEAVPVAPTPVPVPEAVKKVRPVPTAPPPLPPAPVTTDSKAKKNQAGLGSRELEFYRDLLLAKRREIVGDMSSMEREALRGAGSNLSNLPVHMADMGTDNYEQEFTLGLVEKDRQLLREINLALAKTQNGTYGICEGTGKPISKPRLEAQPWAKYSIEHARNLEKHNYRRA